MNMRGIIAFPPSVCRSWWKPNFIATIIMELSPGVMRAFNEIITKDYLLFFMGLIKSAFVIGGWVRERLDFFFLLHSDWLHVCQSGSHTICGWHKSLQGATRSDWESCSKSGKKKEKGGENTSASAVLYWCVWTIGLSFSCPQSTHKNGFSINATLWCIVYLLRL